jgi:hypothetical protein
MTPLLAHATATDAFKVRAVAPSQSRNGSVVASGAVIQRGEIVKTP